jgi:hypothetical protein
MEAIGCRCNTNLGGIIPLYTFLSEKIKKDAKNLKFTTVKVENLSQVQEFTLEMGPLLDLLHLPRECCRTEMLGKSKVSVS